MASDLGLHCLPLSHKNGRYAYMASVLHQCLGTIPSISSNIFEKTDEGKIEKFDQKLDHIMLDLNSFSILSLNRRTLVVSFHVIIYRSLAAQ